MDDDSVTMPKNAMNLLRINYDCLESGVRGKHFEQLKPFFTISRLLKNCQNWLRIYMNQFHKWLSRTDYDSTTKSKIYQIVAIRGFRGLCGIVDDPYMPSGRFYCDPLERSISYKRGVWLVFMITMFYRNSCI